MNVITTDEAAERILNNKGKFFSVTFRKRSDRSLRTMTARTGIRRYVNGQGRSYDAASHKLLSVGEIVGGRNVQYRVVPIEGIRKLRIGGKVFQVETSSRER
jgi:hypothetical protein